MVAATETRGTNVRLSPQAQKQGFAMVMYDERIYILAVTMHSYSGRRKCTRTALGEEQKLMPINQPRYR